VRKGGLPLRWGPQRQDAGEGGPTHTQGGNFKGERPPARQDGEMFHPAPRDTQASRSPVGAAAPTSLQRPPPVGALRVVATGEKQDAA